MSTTTKAKVLKLPKSIKSLVCGRAKRGLFHGKTVLFGNNVSEDGGNKTRRKWLPNAKRKRLFSDILNKMVSVVVTSHALRCIDKAGGLDNYITKTYKMSSVGALELRQKMRERMMPSDVRDVVDLSRAPPPAQAQSTTISE
jgi:large subunit ribosomal protein L28